LSIKVVILYFSDVVLSINVVSSYFTGIALLSLKNVIVLFHWCRFVYQGYNLIFHWCCFVSHECILIISLVLVVLSCVSKL
jgi:hypothetical protein